MPATTSAFSSGLQKASISAGHLARTLRAAADYLPPAVRPIRYSAERVGRNELCPCGSGEKFKRCHLPKSRTLGIFTGRRKATGRKLAGLSPRK